MRKEMGSELLNAYVPRDDLSYRICQTFLAKGPLQIKDCAGNCNQDEDGRPNPWQMFEPPPAFFVWLLHYSGIEFSEIPKLMLAVDLLVKRHGRLKPPQNAQPLL